MRNVRWIALLLLMVLSVQEIYAQLVAQAGRDTLACAGTTIVLGASPTASGGTPPYTYHWSPPTNMNCTTCANPTILAIGSTTYVVTVTDSLGVTDTDSVRIVVAAMYVANAVETLVAPSACNGSDGQIVLKGLCDFCPPSTISYYHNSILHGPFPISGWPQMTINGLEAGLYHGIKVTSYSGCVYNVQDTHALVHPASPAVAFTRTNAKCWGGSDGTACAQVSGGIGPYSYAWSDGATQQCTDSLSNGAYWVTVTDSAGCHMANAVNITQPNPVGVFILSSTGGTPDTVCAVGFGGVGPYAYTWGGNMNSHGNSCFEVLSGIFNLTVTDANACTATKTLDGPLTADAGDAYICPGDSQALGGNTTASGGTPPYTYSWVPVSGISCAGCAHPLASPPATTTYYLTVTDSLGAIATDSVTVFVNDMKIDSIVTTGVSCFGGSDGSACVYFSGGSPPYWHSFGGFPACTSNVAPGIYSFTLWDNSCGIDTNFSIGEPSALQVDSFMTTDVSCNGGNDGLACAQVSGGTPPYTYQWNSLQVVQCISNMPAGICSVTVTDANLCTAVSDTALTEPAPLVVQLTSATGGIFPDTICAIVSGGAGGYSYSWSGGTPLSASCVELQAGSASVTVTDANGCTTATTFGCGVSCVWPGDADHNGIADNYDLLPIGIAHGTTGPSRQQQDINWYPHVSQDWSDTLAGGTNYKHSDCDGSGTINSADTLAILQNFMLTHAKQSGRKDWRITDPALQVNLVPDTVIDGDTMYANISLGDIGIPATNVYGLAFTVNYDATVVDSTKTSVTFGDSWLGTSTDKISIAKDLTANGMLKCAVTRIDHFTRSGYGQIGFASFVITTDNINGKGPLAYHHMEVWISDLAVIDSSGNFIPVNEGSDSAQVEFEPVGVHEIKDHPVRIIPNPAAGEIQLMVSADLLGGEMKLVDITGKVLYAQTVTNTHARLQLAPFENGLYFLQVTAPHGVITRRLVIAR